MRVAVEITVPDHARAALPQVVASLKGQPLTLSGPGGGLCLSARIVQVLPDPAVPQGADDGHQPAFIIDPQLGHIIGCTCGGKPARRSARMTTEHVWHRGHRRALGLPPIERYSGGWPDETGYR